MNWWTNAVFYELYVSSFKDGNGDGKGDFTGVTRKLDYLKELGIEGIWLTPFYKSPKVDNGYDISDYYAVDSEFGTMEEFEKFLKEAHKRGIRIVADMVFNHSSDKCPWFIESRSCKNNPKRDWYIWRKEIPNNWESFFSGSAWEFDEITGEYYLHKFAKEQPDLNWTNRELRNELKKVMKFWFEKGLDGFRLDVLNFINTSGNYDINNPINPDGTQKHLYDMNQKGVHEAISELAVYAKTFGDKVMIGELGGCTINMLKSYTGDKMLDYAFCFNFSNFLKFETEKVFNEIIKMKDKVPATLFFSNHDMERFISRFSEKGIRDIEKAKAVAAITLLAKGTPFIYYGDEIGMTSLQPVALDEINDVEGQNNYKTERAKGKSHKEALVVANERSRDKARSPMQWNSEIFAGFSNVKPWLPVNDNYKTVNVENEIKNKDSLYNFYKEIIAIRKKEKALTYGEYKYIERDDDLIYFSRTYENEEVIVLINYGEKKLNKYFKGPYKVLFGKNNEFIRENEVLILKK